MTKEWKKNKSLKISFHFHVNLELILLENKSINRVNIVHSLSTDIAEYFIFKYNTLPTTKL